MPYDKNKEPFRGNTPRVGAPRRAVPPAVRDDGPNPHRRDNFPKNHNFNRGFEGHRPERRDFNRNFDDSRPEKRDFNRSFDDRRPEKPAFERKYDNRRPAPMAEHRPPQPQRRPYDAPEAPAFRPAPAPMVPPPAPEMPENLLVGRNPIREAIKAGREIEKLLIARGDLSGSAREIVAKAREARIIIQEVDRSRLDVIYPNHQGMIAYTSAAHYAQLEDIFDRAAERSEDPFIIILDGVTDPHNLGAIIRTAECVGAHGVIVPERRSAGLTPAAVKAAAGGCEYMNVVRVTNLNRTLETLKERGVWIVGTTLHGENALRADLTGPIALVIGSEDTGIADLTLKKCDRTLSLPMTGHLDSLNASVAAGVMMYAVMNARQG